MALAGPKEGALFETNSIMSLFNDGVFNRDAPKGLTSFDMAVLQALYNADPAQAAHDEQSDIAFQAVKMLASARTAP